MDIHFQLVLILRRKVNSKGLFVEKRRKISLERTCKSYATEFSKEMTIWEARELFLCASTTIIKARSVKLWLGQESLYFVGIINFQGCGFLVRYHLMDPTTNSYQTGFSWHTHQGRICQVPGLHYAKKDTQGAILALILFVRYSRPQLGWLYKTLEALGWH
jgi:hypothetical protein